MALVLADRVLETTAVAGTGDASLGGAVTGYQPFSVIGGGNTTYYTIVAIDTNGVPTGDWEVGIGTYVTSGNKITRDTVLSSSNGGAKVYFPSGDKQIFLDLPSEEVLLTAGNVYGPTSAVNSNFALYDGTTGKLLKDAGINASTFATAAQGAKADTAVQPGSLGTAAYLNAGSANGVATLDSGGKVPVSQIPALGDLNYQGTWNASTNTPTLVSSSGTKGYYYVVSVSGSTNLNGITDWVIGDWAVFNGSVWQKIDNTDAVTSVNGYTGTVVLTYTDVGAQPAGTYVNSVTGTAPVVSSGGTTPAISMHVADATNDGYLSSTDWSSFNSKVTMTYPGAGIPNSTGTAWGTSYTTTGSGTIVALQSSPLLITPTLSGATIDNSQPWLNFANGSATTLAAGRMWYNGSTGSWNLGMGGGNITQQVGEELFLYGKASNTISDSPLQIVYQTGTVGASGVVTFGHTVSGITDGTLIVGVATENLATNAFGRVTTFGVVHGITTDGSAYGETWADGDTIWYNPVTGNPTKTKPSAPNIKVSVGTVINAGSGGSGSFQVEINHGSVLGGTDSNVQLTSVTNGQFITYDGLNGYWKNTSVTAGTAISVSSSTTGVLTITNSAPDQTVSITGAGGAVVTGTYPNFTITTPSGTVTSVGGTGTVNGITLTGTVTSSGNLTLGGTLSNVSLTSQVTGTLPIANGGTNATTAGAAIANLFGFTSTATAAGTTTLTNTSTFFQLFTGTTTQTVTLPVVSTLAQGWRFNVVNTSTGTVTVNSSGGNLVYAVPTNGAITVACVATSGTTAAGWVIADSTTAVWNA